VGDGSLLWIDYLGDLLSDAQLRKFVLDGLLLSEEVKVDLGCLSDDQVDAGEVVDVEEVESP